MWESPADERPCGWSPGPGYGTLSGSACCSTSSSSSLSSEYRGLKTTLSLANIMSEDLSILRLDPKYQS